MARTSTYLNFLGKTEAAFESFGHKLEPGNDVGICLEPDSRGDAERLFTALGQGGQVTMPLADMFWGDYFGAVTDRFGVHWMVNCSAKA